MEHILFLTGRLAEKALERVLHAMAPAAFTWQIREIGIQVAGLKCRRSRHGGGDLGTRDDWSTPPSVCAAAVSATKTGLSLTAASSSTVLAKDASKVGPTLA